MDPLVDVHWLAGQIERQGAPGELVILDCTVNQADGGEGGFHNVSGQGPYAAAHIPGAGFADLMGALRDAHSALDFPLPPMQQFCEAMESLGVGDDSRVLVYDNNGSAWAARVWWMLRWIGFDRACLLDGGLQAWIAAGHPVTADTVSLPIGSLTPVPRSDIMADLDDVREAIDTGDALLIDTLPEPLYAGDTVPYARAGHLPGAINRSGLALLDAKGCYLPLTQLREQFRFDAVVGQPDSQRRIITYCGGGILASSTAFTLTRLGFENVSVYINSLQEWAADERLPMVIG